MSSIFDHAYVYPANWPDTIPWPSADSISNLPERGAYVDGVTPYVIQLALTGRITTIDPRPQTGKGLIYTPNSMYVTGTAQAGFVLTAQSKTSAVWAPASGSSGGGDGTSVKTYSLPGLLALGDWKIGQSYVVTSGNGTDTYGNGGLIMDCIAGSASIDNSWVYANTGTKYLRARRNGIEINSQATQLIDETDGTAALQAMINNAAVLGGFRKEITIPSFTTIYISDTIVIPKECVGLTIKTPGPRYGTHYAARAGRFVWRGANDRPMFRVEGQDTYFENINFTVSFYDLLTAIDWTNPIGQGNTRLMLSGCNFDFAQGPSGAKMTYCMSIGIDGLQNVNLEELRVIDCTFDGATEACVWIRSGQPYNILYDRCIFAQTRYPWPNGRGFLIDEGRCRVTINNPNVGFFSAFVHTRADAKVSITGKTDQENCKKIYLRESGGPGLGGTFHHQGGRVATVASYAMTGTNPSSAANDMDVISMYGGFGSILLEDCNFAEAGESFPMWRIGANDGISIMANGCVFPNTHPIKRSGPYPDSWNLNRRGGGTFLKGCWGQRSNAEKYVAGTADIWAQIPDRNGCDNPDNSIIFGSGSSTWDVNLRYYEPYMPNITVWSRAVSGTLPGSAQWKLVSQYDNQSFRLQRQDFNGNVLPIPSGTLEEVGYKLSLINPAPQNGHYIESNFPTTGTIMCGAQGVGPMGGDKFTYDFQLQLFEPNTITRESYMSFWNGSTPAGWSLFRYDSLMQFYIAGPGGITYTDFLRMDLQPVQGRQVWLTFVQDGSTLYSYVNGQFVVSASGVTFAKATNSRLSVGAQVGDNRTMTTAGVISACFSTGSATALQVQQTYDRNRLEYGFCGPLTGSGLNTTNFYVFNGTGFAQDQRGDAHIYLTGSINNLTRRMVSQ